MDLPPGYQLSFPGQVYSNVAGLPGNSGVLVLTNTNPQGAGDFSASGDTLLRRGDVAVYEVLASSFTAFDQADVPVTLVYEGDQVDPSAPVVDFVGVSVSYAPFYDPANDPGNAPFDPNGAPIPFPRFVSSPSEMTLFPGAASQSSVQWLKFQTGDPGVPGDGITVQAGPDPSGVFRGNIYFVPQPLLSLPGMTDGFTATIFPTGGTAVQGVTFQMIAASPTGCAGVGWAIGGGGALPTAVVNGVQGTVVSLQQFEFADEAEFLNRASPFCNYNPQDMSVAFIYANNPSGANVLSIDAMAFGLGQNNVPK